MSATPYSPNTILPGIRADEPFRFALLGDLTAPLGQKGQLEDALAIFREGVQTVARWNEEGSLKFVVGIGDFVHLWGPDWDQFTELLRPLAGIPFYPIPGNHDIYSGQTRAEWLERWGHEGLTYTHFVQGGVLFLFIDTEDFEPGQWSHHKGGIRSAQYAHIHQALHRGDWDWALIFMHKPLWLPAHAPADAEGWKEIEDLLSRNPRHTLYAGHTHKQAFSDLQRPARHIIGPTGGRSYNGHQVTLATMPSPRAEPDHEVTELE